MKKLRKEKSNQKVKVQTQKDSAILGASALTRNKKRLKAASEAKKQAEELAEDELDTLAHEKQKTMTLEKQKTMPEKEAPDPGATKDAKESQDEDAAKEDQKGDSAWWGGITK